MKKLFIIFTILVFVISCEKSDNTCNCSDPLNALTWLADIKSSLVNCSCEISILQATYKAQTVYYVAMTDPLCNGIFSVDLRNCDGEIIKSYADIYQFSNEVTGVENLYRCKTP